MLSANEIELVKVDYQNDEHRDSLIELLDHYAQDPMGGGHSLPEYTRNNLCDELSKLSNAVSFLALSDSQACGLVNCFFGFSTFNCKPLLNIHDIVVHENYRGQGIAQALLNQVEKFAREAFCCKLTLEVLENNTVAQTTYERFGFEGYELNPETGKALFWQKKLN